ncbi:MAG: hypothetical protein AAFU79_13520 [Myxococcota bacterium]
MTLSELSELVSTETDLGALTIGEVFGVKGGRGGRPRGTAKATKSKPKKGSRTKTKKAAERNMRTDEARAAFDKEVYGLLKAEGGKVSAEAMRAELGGTPDQLRKSLVRLMEAGRVKRTGKLRATRYQAK